MEYEGIVKTYVMQSPRGEVVQFTNMSLFCRVMDLRAPLLYLVYEGERAHHLGWKRALQCVKPDRIFNAIETVKAASVEHDLFNLVMRA